MKKYPTKFKLIADALKYAYNQFDSTDWEGVTISCYVKKVNGKYIFDDYAIFKKHVIDMVPKRKRWWEKFTVIKYLFGGGK